MCSREPVAGALDVDDDGVVEQAVEERGGRRRRRRTARPHSAKPRLEVRIMAPFSYRALTSWKNRLAPSGSMEDVADLVDDEQGGAGVEAELVGEAVLAAGLAEGRRRVRPGCGGRRSCRP